MHYNPGTAAEAETMRDIAADRVAEAEASIARWQRIRDTRQAEYAQAIEALSWWTFPIYNGADAANPTR